MRLVTFTPAEGPLRPSVGIWVSAGIIDAGHLLGVGSYTEPMIELIDRFDELRESLVSLERAGTAVAVEDIRLLSPLRRPSKIVCCIGNYWEHASREPRPLNMFLKSPDAVVGPGDVVTLPETQDPWIFMHEAELAIVIKGPAKDVAQSNWRDAVFGFTGFLDITARGEGRYTWRAGSWMGKSFDTFAPLGPCIVTADEIADPQRLHVSMWNDGELRHDYDTADMEHQVPEIIEFATMIMTLNSGDVLACGTNHEGLGAVQDGEELRLSVERVGEMKVTVSDPLKRRWERGVYLGADSTNHAAVRQHRPDEVHLLREDSTR